MKFTRPNSVAVISGILVSTACFLGGVTGCASSEPVERPPILGASPDAEIQVIAFGSCARSDRDQTIWDSIVAERPDLFLFIGDNVYVDIPDDPTDRRDFIIKYDQLAAKPGWRKLTATVPVLATWDDHDYGLNDAGAEFPLKAVAQEEFLRFFGVPKDSPRWDREGIYHAETFGPAGKRVQVIMLDTRYFRDPLTRNPAGRVDGLGPYLPNPHGQGTLLGEAQWEWLGDQLRQPADLRVIATSIQVVADEHRWETWGNMPHERERLYKLIGDTGANGVVFVSGDRHLLEISKDTERGVPYPMWDITSSGFNWGKRSVSDPNRFRVGPVTRQPNFGVLRVDWSADKPTVTMEGRDLQGDLLVSAKTDLGELKP
ncbi:MAG: alkaline phosphatase D family protein [Planctomycetota bacterium]